MSKVKYIRTRQNEIIVFSELLNHSDFSNHRPVSAGFISFGVGEDGNPSCSCYGESVSLGFLKSKGDEDAKLADMQILNNRIF
jgi:hypothetical protein